MKRSELFFSVLQIPLDFGALLAAFILSYYIRDQLTPFSSVPLSSVAVRLKYDPTAAVVITFSHYLHDLLIIIPGMLLIFAAAGLYAIRSRVSWGRRILHVFIGVSVGEFFILLLFLLRKDFFLPRSTILYSWLFGTLFVLAIRLLTQLVQQELHRQGIGVIRVGLVGQNHTANQLAHQFIRDPRSSYRLTLHLDDL